MFSSMGIQGLGIAHHQLQWHSVAICNWFCSVPFHTCTLFSVVLSPIWTGQSYFRTFPCRDELIHFLITNDQTCSDGLELREEVHVVQLCPCRTYEAAKFWSEDSLLKQ